MKPKFISVADFCTMLGIGKTKAYELLKSEVKSARVGRRRLIVRSSAISFIDRSIEAEER